jgi:hypothetical protein
MDEKFITKPILRRSEEQLAELRQAYSEKLGVGVSQAEAISLAIEHEHARVVKK